MHFITKEWSILSMLIYSLQWKCADERHKQGPLHAGYRFDRLEYQFSLSFSFAIHGGPRYGSSTDAHKILVCCASNVRSLGSKIETPSSYRTSIFPGSHIGVLFCLICASIRLAMIKHGGSKILRWKTGSKLLLQWNACIDWLEGLVRGLQATTVISGARSP